MAISESEQYDLLDRLAEEFADRYRRGERPALKEYTDRYPELADEIRELFPAMFKVEQVEDLRQGGQEGDGSRPRSHLRGRSATTGFSARSAGAAWASCTRPSRSRWAGGWPSRSCRGRFPATGGPGAVSPRGPRRGPIAPHQYRAGLRGGPGRGRPLLCDAVYPGPGTRRRHHRAAAASRPRGAGVHDQGTLRRPVATTRGKRSGEGIADATRGAEVEFSAVVQSMLSGRFDPGGRSPETAEPRTSTPARAVAGGLAAPNEIGAEQRARRTSIPP